MAAELLPHEHVPESCVKFLTAPTRRNILQELFGKGGDSVWMQPPFFCDYGSNTELVERVFFNFNCVVLDVCRIRIGDFTLFGPGAKLLTPVHPFKAALRRKEEYARPIDFGSDVWVGAGALVLPGVRIGSRSVIGAGSVVTETFRKVFSRPVTHAASSLRFLKRNPANIVLYSREVTDVVPRPLLSTKRRCSQTTVRPGRLELTDRRPN